MRNCVTDEGCASKVNPEIDTRIETGQHRFCDHKITKTSDVFAAIANLGYNEDKVIVKTQIQNKSNIYWLIFFFLSHYKKYPVLYRCNPAPFKTQAVGSRNSVSFTLNYITHSHRLLDTDC